MFDASQLQLYKLKGTKVTDAFSAMRVAFNKWTLLIIIFIIGFATSLVFVENKIGLFPARLNYAIASKNTKSLKNNLIEYFIWMLVMCLSISLQIWVGDRTSILLRENLVNKIHSLYFHENAFYELLIYNAEIDNPDARIANDCYCWADNLIQIVDGCVKMPFYIFYYGYQTYIESGIKSVLICIGFSVLVIILSRLVITPIIRLINTFEAANGDYRLANTLIKQNAESIALSKGQECERNLITKRLEAAFSIQKSLANHSVLLNLLTNSVNYVGNAIVYLSVYMNFPRTLTPPEVSKYVSTVSFVMIQFVSGLIMISTFMQNFSKLCGYSARIIGLINVLKDHKSMVCEPLIGDEIKMENVDVVKPNNELLIGHITFTVKKSESVFIVGPSGCGKSSIFRALGKVWPIGGGTITLPERSADVFLIITQYPYLPVGTLVECCCFPIDVSEVSSEAVHEAISFFELDHLLLRPDESWQNGLSPGERQRIALCRIMIHKPEFLLIDEGTSAIPQELELKFYQWMRDNKITYISIAHHLNLMKFHKFVLRINEDKTSSFKLNPDFV